MCVSRAMRSSRVDREGPSPHDPAPPVSFHKKQAGWQAGTPSASLETNGKHARFQLFGCRGFVNIFVTRWPLLQMFWRVTLDAGGITRLDRAAEAVRKCGEAQADNEVAAAAAAAATASVAVEDEVWQAAGVVEKTPLLISKCNLPLYQHRALVFSSHKLCFFEFHAK